MTKVYLRAEDNEAGVTLEEARGVIDESLTVRFAVEGFDTETGTPFIKAGAYLTDTEARAVVEGLLRRMLERDGAMSERDVDGFKRVLRYLREER